MVNATEGRFEPITPDLAKKFAVSPNNLEMESKLSPIETKQRDWTRFQEGESIQVKGVNFVVHEIGETRMVLKLVKG